MNCTDNSMEDLWICILEEWDRRQGDKDPADLRELEKLVGKEKYFEDCTDLRELDFEEEDLIFWIF